MTRLAWGIALLSLLGVVLNIHHRRACFAVWSFTNAYWMVLDAQAGLPAQACLQAVYVGLAIYGWHRWQPTTTPAAPAPP